MKYILTALISLFCIPSMANVIGTDVQNFNPTNDGLDFVTVHSSDTLEEGLINFGLFYNYAKNSLTGYTNGTEPNDGLHSADFNFGIGVTDDFNVGMSFPQVLKQTVDEGVFGTVFEETGQTEMRFYGKYRIMKRENYGFASIVTINQPQVANNPFTGTNPGPILNIEFALDTRMGQYKFGTNFGFRFRDKGTPITLTGSADIDPLGNQFIASVAMSRYFNRFDTNFIAELYSSYPLQDEVNTTDRELSTMELLLGAKYNVDSQWAVHTGFTTKVFDGTSTPDYRLYAGVHYTIGPKWGDKGYEEVTPTPSTEEERPSRIIRLRDVNFAFGKSNLPNTKVSPVILRVAKELNNEKSKIKKIIIEGHTDSVGSEEYNQKLSVQRAGYVRTQLIKNLQFNTDIITIRGYGENFPIADNTNYQGRKRNRRVEIKIYMK